MLHKGISMKNEILKESHLICRTVLHFSEYGFSHENIYDQVMTIIQWLAKTELSTTSSYNQDLWKSYNQYILHLFCRINHCVLQCPCQIACMSLG